MIKDTVQLQGFSQMKLPKIKGTVEIKLHNPTTGKTEIHRGENMVTNAVADIFACNYCGATDYRKLLPVWQKMYGGVLCFAQSLDVSSSGAANDYFIPDNGVNTVTAHAGQTAYTDQADDTSRGSPSSANMSINDGTVTLSWEWGLSSGNGPISALALTHTDVGNAGTGSTSNAFKNMIPCINARAGFTFNHDSSDYGKNLVLFVGSDGYGYRFYASGHNVTIVKIPLMYEKTGLVAQAPFTDTDQNTSTTITVTTEYGAVSNRQMFPMYFYDKNTNKLWLFYSLGTTTSPSVEEINLSTMTATNRNSSFANLNASVGPLHNWGYTGLVIPYYNGSVYLRKGISSYNTPLCNGFLRVNLSNPADQTNMSATVNPLGGTFAPNTANKVLAGRQFVINNNVIYPCTSQDTYSVGHYGDYGGFRDFAFMDENVGLALLGGQFFEGNTTSSYYNVVSKFYLGTKYNLQTPVQKTPSQSMLITYTLTEVAPNE